MVLEDQLENVVFTDAIGRIRMPDRVSQQGQTGQRKVVLESFEEKETGVGENHPQFLPSIGTFELAQEVAGKQIAERAVVLADGYGGTSVPANVYRGIGSLLSGIGLLGDWGRR